MVESTIAITFETLGTFSQKKALVGALFVIVKTDGSFAALLFSGVD